MDEVWFDGGVVDDVLGSGGDDELSVVGAREFAVVVWYEGVEESEMSSEDAELNAGGICHGGSFGSRD